jgi:hypothetical protein
MPEQFENSDSCPVCDIHTGDEAWTHQSDPETKCQAAIWIFADDFPFVKMTRASVENKMCIWFKLCLKLNILVSHDGTGTQ